MKDKIKELVSKKQTEPNKKKIENLVVFLVILIITIIVINTIWNADKKASTENKVDSNKKLAQVNTMVETDSAIKEDNTITNLEEILSKISGVGKVKVMITYSQTSQTIPLYNEDSSEKNTEESDKQGGNRKVTEKDSKKEVIYKEENGQKIPITQSVISPTMEGAIVTAEGANNAAVKTNIIQAVEAVTGLATHKIQVFEMAQAN